MFHLVRYPLFPLINPRINLNSAKPHTSRVCLHSRLNTSVLDLFCIQGLFATDTLYSFIFPLPVDESNQGSKRFLVESHGKPFQRLDVLNRCRSSLPLRSIISRTGRTQIISGLALAPHSYGELIDNWRSEDDLSDVLLGGTKDTRSSLYCCWVGEVGFVICTCRDVIRAS